MEENRERASFFSCPSWWSLKRTSLTYWSEGDKTTAKCMREEMKLTGIRQARRKWSKSNKRNKRQVRQRIGEEKLPNVGRNAVVKKKKDKYHCVVLS